MSKVDIVLVLLLGLGGLLGYKRGFLMELFFLFALVIGIFVGFKLMGVGVGYLHNEFNSDTKFLPAISFLIIFVGVVILVTFLGRMIKNLVDKTFLGRIDALAGGILGVVKYMFCASVLIWLLSSVHVGFPERWTRDSWLYPVTVSFAPGLEDFFSGFLPVFKGIFKQF